MPSLRLRIELRDVEPTIWREVVVPTDLPLTELHSAIQAAMGWGNAHPYSFARGEDSASGMVWASVRLDGALPLDGARLDALVAEVGDTATYRYDFGDNWQHELRVLDGAPEPAQAGSDVALLDGAGACPPEDCGGARGYSELLGWVADLEAGRSVPKRALAQLNWVAGSLDARAIRRVLQYDGAVAARRVATASTPLPALRSDVADLLSRAPGGGSGVLREMVVLADLARPERLDDGECEMLTSDLRWFLDFVGPEGLPLTAAGHLKPSAVTHVAQHLDLDRERFGKMNQEELTLPVTHLRQAAASLGLVRIVKRTLQRSGAGHALLEDPRGLVELMVDKLPVGAPGFERDGGLVLLLDLAGRDVREGDAPEASSPKERRSAVEQERREREAMIGRIGEAMASLGWRGERGPVTGWEVRKEAAGTLAVLERCGIVALDRRGAGWNPTPIGRAFLVWALRPGA